MFRRTEKGFTLVELMIVVVIIGILAAIAIPKFSGMIGKTKTVEAKQQLGTIINLEKTYFYSGNKYVDFAAGADCDAIGYQQPDAPKRFNYSFANAAATDSTQIATAIELEDVNNDGDTADGLTLTIFNVQGNIGNLSW